MDVSGKLSLWYLDREEGRGLRPAYDTRCDRSAPGRQREAEESHLLSLRLQFCCCNFSAAALSEVKMDQQGRKVF